MKKPSHSLYLALILGMLLMLNIPNSYAFCYYLTNSEGDEYNSIFPPYSLSYPRNTPLSRKEIKYRQHLGHLSITLDRTGCSREPFPAHVLNPEPPEPEPPAIPAPRRTTPRYGAFPPPVKEEAAPMPMPVVDEPEPIPEPIETPPPREKTAPTTALTEIHILDTLGSMDSALSRKDLEMYQAYLGEELSITQSVPDKPPKQKTLSRVDYVSDLQQQLQRVSEYKIQHKKVQIHLDLDTNTAEVASLVSLTGTYKNNLPINTEYREVAIFAWDNVLKQAVLQELTMQQEQADTKEETAVVETNKVDSGDFCAEVGKPSKVDCKTLVSLYNSTGGIQWQKVHGWMQTKEPCQWSGVSCSTNRVVGLNLVRKKLRHKLPDLSALTHLTELRLAKNKLSGEIPDFSALRRLKILDLSRNSLSGQIPDMSALKQLEEFSAAHNNLSDSIPVMSTLSKLKVLELNNNKLSGEMPDLSALTQLQRLKLSYNQLEGALKGVDKLVELREAYLHKNQFTGSIEAISQWKQIRKLYLNNNQFSGNLPAFDKLSRLEKLSVAHNQLSGVLPPSLNELRDVEWLQLNDNQLTGPIPDWRHLKRLKIFDVSNNQLCGEVPMWLSEGGLQRDNSSLKLLNNRLTANNPTMKAFLDEKAPGWHSSQQPPPATCP